MPGMLTRLFLAAALTLGAGCGSVAEAPSAGDGGAARIDAEVVADAETPDRPATDRDATQTADATQMADAAQTADATQMADAAQTADAARPADATTPADATARVDARPDAPEEPERYVRFRVAAVNAPESARPGLLAPPLARAQRLVELLAADDVTAAAVQESGTWLRRAAAEARGWSSTWAPPNNVLGDREVGNGIAYRAAPLEILDARDLRVPMPDHPRGLNFPVRLFEHRLDADRRARFVMISFHAPTRRDDPDDTTRVAVRRALLEYVRRCHRVGLPVVLAGDANDGAYGGYFRGDLEAAFNHGVDWILVSREVRVHGGFSRAIPLLSDHDAIVAAVSVPARGDAPRRLPD